ncbi:MAG TPA: 4-(cytidine 5'-diphospho)-2-C-methyl-D-erythritol kinase, partial [Chryseosolibacter sp.]
MVSFPPCKINLGLHVIRKLPDGYHDLLTCFYPVPWQDVLEIVPSKEFAFTMSGRPIPGALADNLCVRAYELLKKDFELKPVEMHLMKIVPTGAGLGGGSADGAYTLKILNEIFELGLTTGILRQYAALLGSDCAFFVESKPMIGTGRGEILSEVALSLKGKYLVIVKPEVRISTADAYAEITPRRPAADLKTILETHPVKDWKELLTNDFTEPMYKKFPLIEAIN